MSKAASELAHLFRALKAPDAARALPVLADRAREEQWSYERFAEVLLGTEVSARESHGGEGRIKAARFPARKTLERPPRRRDGRVWRALPDRGRRARPPGRPQVPPRPVALRQHAALRLLA
jgi:hypothetical protein